MSDAVVGHVKPACKQTLETIRVANSLHPSGVTFVFELGCILFIIISTVESCSGKCVVNGRRTGGPRTRGPRTGGRIPYWFTTFHVCSRERTTSFAELHSHRDFDKF